MIVICVFGLLKSSIDAHTIGLNSVANLLEECGFTVVLSDNKVSKAIEALDNTKNVEFLQDWIVSNSISKLSFSYRLDPDDGFILFDRLYQTLKRIRLFRFQGGPVQDVYFAGLPKACEIVSKSYLNQVKVFRGGETPKETLEIFGFPVDYLPSDVKNSSEYDDIRLQFADELIKKDLYKYLKLIDRSGYKSFGKKDDSVVSRILYSRGNGQLPLFRAHIGPYIEDREKAVTLFRDWVTQLAKPSFLDILSIGTSQLSQSTFGESWNHLPNGGGVRINSPEEFEEIWNISRPMLVRTYAGTKNVPTLARIYERTLNIAWHALSFWWFCKTDGRGPNSVLDNLREHLETLRYIAATGKPFEPNIPHHFSFRGSDDVTYIVSAYLAAKVAKTCGVKSLILQNMLNTPRSTWGVQDIAKSRVLLSLVRSLEDYSFKVFLQPTAGLDYFSPDLEKAKVQLAAITAMMDDIVPSDLSSPDIIHVVSYSEGSHLATPDVVNESIQITMNALSEYRRLKRKGWIDMESYEKEITERMNDLFANARSIIESIESSIASPYSVDGLYTIFAAGYLPTPYLWLEKEEFVNAIKWQTKILKGSVRVVNEHGSVVNSKEIAGEAEKEIRKATKLSEN